MQFLNVKIKNLNIELNNYCDLKCPGCFSQSNCFEKTVKNLDLNIIKNLLEKNKFNKIELLGNIGEPSLHPDFLEILKIIKKYNNVHIYSNMSKLNLDLWKSVNSILDKKDKIFVTICGLNQENHSKYRIGSKLSNIFNNIKMLDKDKIVLNFLKFDYNKEDIPKLKELNYNFIISEPDLSLTENFKTESVYLKLLNEKQLRNKKIIDLISRRKPKFIYCSFQQGNIFLNYDGNIYPCIFGCMLGLNPIYKYNKIEDLHSTRICWNCNNFLFKNNFLDKCEN